MVILLAGAIMNCTKCAPAQVTEMIRSKLKTNDADPLRDLIFLLSVPDSRNNDKRSLNASQWAT